MLDPRPDSPRRPRAIIFAVVAVAASLLVLDLSWLGLVASDLYASALGPLKRPEAYGPPAAIFYALYIAAIVIHAVLPSPRASTAIKRGAGLGLVAYATYELTNWAVIRDWPVVLVPIDIAWGVVLTAVASTAGQAVYSRMNHPSEPNSPDRTKKFE